jgi:hypothetical protein
MKKNLWTIIDFSGSPIGAGNYKSKTRLGAIKKFINQNYPWELEKYEGYNGMFFTIKSGKSLKRVAIVLARKNDMSYTGM